MYGKMISLVLMVVAMFAFACAPLKSSTTVDTANGHSNCVQTRYGLECNTNTQAQFDDCRRINTQAMGDSGADAYCRCVTTGGQVIPSQNPAIPPTCMPTYGGTMTGGYNGYSTGAYGMPATVPGRFPGYPGSAVVILPDTTPAGVIAMENSGAGGRIVQAPGSSTQAVPSGDAASNRDVENLARAAVAQHEAFCRHFPRDCACRSDCSRK